MAGRVSHRHAATKTARVAKTSSNKPTAIIVVTFFASFRFTLKCQGVAFGFLSLEFPRFRVLAGQVRVELAFAGSCPFFPAPQGFALFPSAHWVAAKLFQFSLSPPGALERRPKPYQCLCFQLANAPFR